jgi:hypothetical protein
MHVTQVFLGSAGKGGDYISRERYCEVREMDKRSLMCDENCEQCPFASCNFNPLFPLVFTEESREEEDQGEDSQYTPIQLEDSVVYRWATRYRSFIHP